MRRRLGRRRNCGSGIMGGEIGARPSPTYGPTRGSARRVCFCWKPSDDVIDRRGEADMQFVIELLKTILYRLNVLIQVLR